jgi:hypothetical protein
VGVRHARKHLGWALDAAAACAGVPAEMSRKHRTLVLTAERPDDVMDRLADAYDAFGPRTAA